MKVEMAANYLFKQVGVEKEFNSDRWYLQYFLANDFAVSVEITAREFAEKLVGLPVITQKDLIRAILDELKKPGDLMVLGGPSSGGVKSVQIVRLNRKEEDNFNDVHLLIAR